MPTPFFNSSNARQAMAATFCYEGPSGPLRAHHAQEVVLRRSAGTHPRGAVPTLCRMNSHARPSKRSPGKPLPGHGWRLHTHFAAVSSCKLTQEHPERSTHRPVWATSGLCRRPAHPAFRVFSIPTSAPANGPLPDKVQKQAPCPRRKDGSCPWQPSQFWDATREPRGPMAAT